MEVPPEVPKWRQEFNACRNCNGLENELAEARAEVARLRKALELGLGPDDLKNDIVYPDER
jgi:hypothetical protein